MLLEDVKMEFVFNCQCRKLSERTIKNYSKQIGYLLRFLVDEHGIIKIQDVKPQHIKQFLMNMRSCICQLKKGPGK